MRKWKLLILMLLMITIVQAAFFTDSEGAQNEPTGGLWTTVKAWFMGELCFPIWQPQYGSCLTNDTRLIIYNDLNSCGWGSPPADNGTFSGFCNYCLWDLNITPTTTCQGSNETYNATVYDSHWFNCCNITGLDSDCYQDDTDNFNKTYYEVLECEEEINMWEIALIIVPLLLGFLFIIGSALLGEDHNILKIFLFILSTVTPIISLQYAISIINHFEPSLGTLISDIGTHVMIIAWVFFVILIYFILYAVVKLINYLAKKKEDKLNY